MQTVEIHLTDDDLADRMAEMRLWLDRRRYEPSRFACRHRRDGVVIFVQFTIVAEARAFSDKFAGHLVPG